MLPPLLTRRGVIASGGIVAASLPFDAAGVDLKDFGAQEGKDIAPALNRALQEGGGAPIHIGPGEFRLESPFVYHNREKLGSSSRVAGLVLVGSGARRTVIECKAQGGAGIEVEQELPYRFTVGGRLEGFTLTGNPKAPNQDGLRLSGAWNYLISDVEVIGFTGHGLSLPWREDLHWELGGVEIVADSRIAKRRIDIGGFHEDMRIWGGLRIFGHGIAPGATISRLIDETTLELSAPATDSGTRTVELVGNPDAFTSIVEIHRSAFMDNDGWGLWGGAGVGATVTWVESQVARNKMGGVFCGGNGWSFFGGEIDNSDGVGLLVDRVPGGGVPVMLKVERIEFDSNTGGHVWLKEILTATFEQCRFISHYAPDRRLHRPEIGLIIGNNPTTRVTRNVELKGCQFRAPPVGPEKYAGISFGASGSYRHVDIIDPVWIARAPQHRLFDNEPDLDANVRVREDGLTSYAGRTARAWAILERRADQRIAPGRMTELLFDQVQGTLAGGAGEQRLVRARATANGTRLELEEEAPGIKPGMPISDASGRALIGGTRILAAQGRQIEISAPATANGEFSALVGGLGIPYAQLYEIEACVTVEGAVAGSAIDLALAVNGQIVRKCTAAAAGIPRQTATIRALLPLAAGVRVSLLLEHDGPRDIVATQGAEGGALSLIAAT